MPIGMITAAVHRHWRFIEEAAMRKTLLDAKRELSIRRILTDGAIMSGVLGTTIVAVLAYNPDILHDDYPPAIQAKAPPMSQAAKRQRLIVTVPFLAALLSLPVQSNRKLKRQNAGQLSFGAAMINAYAVFTLSNLFDLVALDYLIGARLRPDFAALPGTAGMDAYGDVAFHVRGFFKGQAGALIPCALIAWATSRAW
jgi:hypothetical protein